MLSGAVVLETRFRYPGEVSGLADEDLLVGYGVWVGGRKVGCNGCYLGLVRSVYNRRMCRRKWVVEILTLRAWIGYARGPRDA